MSYLQKHWEETWRFFCILFRIVLRSTRPVFSFILFFPTSPKCPNFTRLVTEGSSIKGINASTSVREPISIDYQCATKSRSAWKHSLIVRYVFRAEFNVETNDPPRAGWMELAGRIWPVGRTLPTPGLVSFWRLLIPASWLEPTSDQSLTRQLSLLHFT